MANLLYLGNSHLVRDAISLHDADGIAKESITVLGHRFRYRYRVASAIDIGRTIDVYRVVLNVAEIDGVLADGLYRYCFGD